MAIHQTVVELAIFERQAKAIMSDGERGAIVDYIAANPEAGVSLGGGLRKVRVARDGGGKSGGYRTLFVFGGVHIPLFLVGVFAKNDKSNLTKAEQAHLVQLSKMLLASHGEQR
ncbi:MAG: type II toxin-antitoxin system RelE/ParE family toxin [Rhodobacteraceae bacterium]|nr:type II toxin-antitoxin system RelE/ParE family toxin [Paracoccaceae bacterium]